MIAVAPSHKNQLGNYTSWLTKRGIPYRILNEGDTLKGFTALLLCGGPDVGSSPKRDELEISWFKEAYGKIPVIGVCRGLQISNVILGGTLHEDLSCEKIVHTSNKVQIAGEPQPTLESSWHDVVFNDGRKIRVNSRHHQGIDTLAPGLKVLAICEEDGLVEMAEGDNALFVQWHPERPDVWGTEAESIVFEWLKERVKPGQAKNDVQLILEYMDRKGFSVISNERVRKLAGEHLTDDRIERLLSENSTLLRRSKDKMGRRAIKRL